LKPKKNIFICSECGFDSAKWSGICPSCGSGNTMVESKIIVDKNVKYRVKNKPTKSSDIEFQSFKKSTGIKELDRVFGGGITDGSLILLGGAPGVGKSTILLQIAENFNNVLYVSGEECKSQIKTRSKRLGIKDENILIMSETDIDCIVETIYKLKVDLVIVDSVQTMNRSSIPSVSGSIAQVKECAITFLVAAKELEIPIIIVSHVNKEGAIAGPKTLEHIVDVVLYFEGENKTPYRIIRCVKNRFGSTNEIGVFQMSPEGLEEVKDPSEIMLNGRAIGVPGTCIACIIEGTRAILTEVQALVSHSFGTPRRVSNGYDYNRLCMILAVLEKRAGLFFSNSDVYVNIVGGIKLNDTSADLPIAIALISALKDNVVPSNIVAFGEIGLSGEIRHSSYTNIRIKEASRLGFKKFLVPNSNYEKFENELRIKNVKEMLYVLHKAYPEKPIS